MATPSSVAALKMRRRLGIDFRKFHYATPNEAKSAARETVAQSAVAANKIWCAVRLPIRLQ